MKKIYWRPHRVSRVELGLIAALSLAGLYAVETWLVEKRQPYYAEKITAAKLALSAFETIKTEKLARGGKIDPEADPAMSGMIGELMTPVTTNTGHLPSKQTSVNPNFAAVVVHYLKRAGVESGDVVAAGISGSFPALNVAVFAALKAIGAKPIIIASVAGSQWGANDANFMWPDMETVLVNRGIFDFKSVAASRGGFEDRAFGLSKEGRGLIDTAIARNGTPLINAKNFDDSLNQRMIIYQQYAGDNPVKAYINVGGGTTSVGTWVGKKLFHPGLNREIPRGSGTVDSVMLRYAHRGVPVIHITQISAIAQAYGLPQSPAFMPPVGQGAVFSKLEYNPALAAVVLAIILASMVAFIRRDWGFRILASAGREKHREHPEQMV